MKRRISLISIIILLIVSIETISLGFSIDMNLNKTQNLKINDEVILTLDLSEKIVGASFKISYDTNHLELVGSDSQNLSVSVNNRKIACVYFDIAKAGTNNLKIKFKIINNIENNIIFNLEETKFVTLENETSYSQDNIIGFNKTITIEKLNSSDNEQNNTSNQDSNNEKIESNIINDSKEEIIIKNISNKTENTIQSNTIKNYDYTTANSNIPKTGENDIIFIFIGITIMLAIYFAMKIKAVDNHIQKNI